MSRETLIEAGEYHREAGRRNSARRMVLHYKLLRWAKRNHPADLERLWKQANKEIPNLSGRKAKLRVR